MFGLIRDEAPSGSNGGSMSPTIPILSALLLSLISGSTGGEQERTDPVPLLWQTLRYWYEIYKRYREEVTFGYCWTSYLLKISSANANIANCSDPIVGGTRSQRELVPLRNATADAAATTTFGGTREEIHQPREKRSLARSTITKFANDDVPNERRVFFASSKRSKIIRERGEQTMNETEKNASRAAPDYNYAERDGKVDGTERTGEPVAPVIDYYARRRRRALPIVPELPLGAPGDGHESSSRGASSHAVDPTADPYGDDGKVDFGSADPREEDSRREVLHLLSGHRDSSAEDASFSFEVTRSGGSLGGRRFPSRPSRKKNSRVDGTLSDDPWMPREDHGIENDPAGRRSPLNSALKKCGESSSTPSQFRRADAQHPRTSVVKLTDSEGSSSCDPINSKTPRQGPEELSRDSLSPRGGGEAIKRSTLKTIGGGDTKKRCSQRPREGRDSRGRRDVSTAMTRPSFSSEFRRSRRQTFHENHGGPPVLIPQKSGQNPDGDDLVKNVPSLFNAGQFIGDYDDPASQLAQHLKPVAMQTSGDPNRLSLTKRPTVKSVSLIVTVFRTLRMFVEVGRKFINVMETNAGLICMRDYLLTKFVKWLEA